MSESFAAKRNALFACLDNASKEIEGTSLDQKSLAHRKSPRYETFIAEAPKMVTNNLSHLRGKESMFKKPERPIGKCLRARKTPDYEVNPHKWKKYSLADVDISDHTNTAAAFDFLREMDRQHEQEEEEEEAAIAKQSSSIAEGGGSPQKIEFKKSSKILRNLKHLKKDEVADAETDKPKLRGSKLLMPEYVVGQNASERKPKKTNSLIRKRSKHSVANGSLKLSHLDAEDDIE